MAINHLLAGMILQLPSSKLTCCWLDCFSSLFVSIKIRWVFQLAMLAYCGVVSWSLFSHTKFEEKYVICTRLKLEIIFPPPQFFGNKEMPPKKVGGSTTSWHQDVLKMIVLLFWITEVRWSEIHVGGYPAGPNRGRVTPYLLTKSVWENLACYILCDPVKMGTLCWWSKLFVESLCDHGSRRTLGMNDNTTEGFDWCSIES